MFFVGNWRDRPRNFTPSHFSVTNYSTTIKPKTEMKEFPDDIFKNLHLIPDPLKKNLADQFTNPEVYKTQEKMPEHIEMGPEQNESTLSGITNFISSVFNVLSSAMFRRAKTEDSHQMASDWQAASKECKNGPSDHILGDDIKKDMSDCRAAATKCEDKLNKVRLLLNSRNSSSPVKLRSRRPRRVFVEPNSIEEHYHDAFSPEDYINMPNESYTEYYSPKQYQSPEYFEAQSPNMRILHKEVNETIEIGNHLPYNGVNNNKDVPDNVNNTKCLLNQNNVNLVDKSNKDEVITSCEDKLWKLKAMLQENRKKNTNLQTMPTQTEKTTQTGQKPSKSIPITRTKDKRFKNQNRLCDKRMKAQMKQNIQDELLFANEITLDESSYEESPVFHKLGRIYEDIRYSPVSLSPVDCFDEITGKFCTSNSSEDSFQIVFNDIPRLHRLSDCDSEDSFIVFDDSPKNCYTSNDVFGDSDTDSDSDLSDSECENIRLTASLSRTLSNLTDNYLYNEDVVDFAKVADKDKKTGLLVDEKRKELKRNLPPKRVRFSADPPKVHVMRVWAFAARQARAGHWERYAVDRERFKRRIADVDMAVSWVLKPQHRSRVMFQRFMPWWNAQKRKELAEKKEKEEEERLRVQEEMEREKLRIELERLQVEATVLPSSVELDGNVGSIIPEVADVVDQMNNSKEVVEKYSNADSTDLIKAKDDKEISHSDSETRSSTDDVNIPSILKEVTDIAVLAKSDLVPKSPVNKLKNNKDGNEIKRHDNLNVQSEVNYKISNDMRVDCNDIITT